MKFAIVGAGAIGGFVGAKLAKAGEEVSMLARGPHGKAMRERGVTVRSADGEFVAHPLVSDDPAELGPADAVFLAVKAHSLPALVERLGPLLGPETSVVTAQNGIPWWYFQQHGGPWEGTRLESVDPGGKIAAAIEPRRIIGCIVYCSTRIAEPGVIQQEEGNRFSIGEPSGEVTDRCRRISQAFQRAGLKCPIRRHIRHDIWVKAIGNAAVNPISALTRATLGEMFADCETRALAQRIMEEGTEVAAKLGVRLEITIEQRMAGIAEHPEHRTSMLQDIEAGRPLELEAICGTVVELAGKLGIAAPSTRAVYACTRLLAQKTLPALK